jgi:peptidylprolyl isomerase
MKSRWQRFLPFLLVPVLAVAVLAACSAGGMKVADNTVVQLNYKGTFSDGTVFDSSEGREPLEFLVGSGLIIPGLEQGIMGLRAGEKKRVEVKAADAYGEYDPAARQEVPKDQFPEDMKLEAGMQLFAQTPQGPIPVNIAEIKENTVVVDFNHPLAGKDLIFDVEILQVRKPTAEELGQQPAEATASEPEAAPAEAK